MFEEKCQCITFLKGQVATCIPTPNMEREETVLVRSWTTDHQPVSIRRYLRSAFRKDACANRRWTDTLASERTVVDAKEEFVIPPMDIACFRNELEYFARTVDCAPSDFQSTKIIFFTNEQSKYEFNRTNLWRYYTENPVLYRYIVNYPTLVPNLLEMVTVELLAELANCLANVSSPYEKTSSVRSDVLDEQINSHLINNQESICNDRKSYLSQWRKTNSREKNTGHKFRSYRRKRTIRSGQDSNHGHLMRNVDTSVQNSQIPQCDVACSKVFEVYFYVCSMHRDELLFAVRLYSFFDRTRQYYGPVKMKQWKNNFQLHKYDVLPVELTEIPVHKNHEAKLAQIGISEGIVDRTRQQDNRNGLIAQPQIDRNQLLFPLQSELRFTYCEKDEEAGEYYLFRWHARIENSSSKPNTMTVESSVVFRFGFRATTVFGVA
ncbi:hypothetical protein CLF_103044 [Clonorchis sinensis]|uniref:Uncharacterized protein n=1 Tax=Clonorchis sinensis TaxID=79923 RepID=G7Y8Y7_CLOSI|nr:hypothetical protein CLF_103044 [Clonorchis sinensis]